MPLSDLTRESILAAINEFNLLGRDEFLKKYNFGKSRGYYVVSDGKLYDSKAIAGVAHARLGDGFALLKAGDFSGVEGTVGRRLESLGFEVRKPSDFDLQKIPFEIGKLYRRQSDIHEKFGGQERGGVTTPSDVPFIFLFTGESGTQYGYQDGWRQDGSFSYTGEGQSGDMKFVRGNRAVRDHLVDGKDLLLFEAVDSGRYRYRGCFACSGWEIKDAPDLGGKLREAIVFSLVPVGGVEGSDDLNETPSISNDLAELRRRAYLAAAASGQRNNKDARRTYYERSAVVRAYVLQRAAGLCESCGHPAPFIRLDGTPYLEPHHTRRVADGGPDHPRWVGALCPTCHRNIHHGKDGQELNRRLQERLSSLEPAEDEVVVQ
jgi:5-methylcytosine-specific restriction protein A